MDKFLALSQEKQSAIIEAGFLCFGKMGYKKTSAKDIATEAGISKGMIFHYFGSKKGLYLYLGKVAYEELIHSFREGYDSTTTDFFDRILMATKCKLGAMKSHPSLMGFLTSMYFETDIEVSGELSEFLEQGSQFRSALVFDELDRKKFKEGVKPELALTLLVKYAEGCVGNLSVGVELDVESMNQEFTECVWMLKNNLYKEEYL